MLAAYISRAEVYTPRSPRKNQYYRCVEAHFEELEDTWEDRYQKEYGYRRPYVLDVIYKYLDCEKANSYHYHLAKAIKEAGYDVIV